MYSLIRTVAPIAEPVTLVQLRQQCRLDPADHSQDALLALYLQAAREFCEDRTGRSILAQTWTLTLDRFPVRTPGSSLDQPWHSWGPGNFGWSPLYAANTSILLARGPVDSVVAVTYFDPARVLQTLDPAQYVADLAGGRLGPAAGSWWPATAAQPAAVQVVYTTGLAAAPAGLQLVMLLLAGHWFENREATQAALTGNGPMPLPLGVDDLLAPYTSTALTWEP